MFPPSALLAALVCLCGLAERDPPAQIHTLIVSPGNSPDLAMTALEGAGIRIARGLGEVRSAGLPLGGLEDLVKIPAVGTARLHQWHRAVPPRPGTDTRSARLSEELK